LYYTSAKQAGGVSRRVVWTVIEETPDAGPLAAKAPGFHVKQAAETPILVSTASVASNAPPQPAIDAFDFFASNLIA